MLTISNAITAAFALIMAPFRSYPVTGMIVISVVTGVLMLLVYKYTSNQKGITAAKNGIKANFLAIMLFKDSLLVLFKSIGSILKWNLKYMGHNLKPLAVMIAPVLLLLVQLNFWYGYRQFEPGEKALVDVRVAPQVNLAQTPVQLETDKGVAVETPGVRIPKTGEIAWRIRAVEPGVHKLVVRVGDISSEKEFDVGKSDKLVRLSPLRHSGGFWDGLLYPGEPKLEGGITSIRVEYPGAKMNIWRWHIHWIIVYFVLSILAGLSMKGLFKVDI